MMLLLRNASCGHSIGMANVLGRHLLEAQRAKMALSGYTGWAVEEEPDHDVVAESLAMPWVPCGVCGRHDLIRTPMLMGGGAP